MSRENDEKLTAGKVLLAIAGGAITIEISRVLMALAVQSAYGVDTDVYYMGQVSFSFLLVLMIIVSSVMGGFFAGSIAKKKGWLFGTLVAMIPPSLSAAFIFVSILGRELTPSGEVWLKQSMLDGGIWVAIQLLPCMLGGIVGEKMVKRELEQTSAEADHLLAAGNENLWGEASREGGILSFYLAPRWRLLFTVPFLALCLYLLIYYLGDAFLFLKWATIGAIYVLVHPSLWAFWYIFPICEFLFGLLFAAFMLPVLAPGWAYHIASKSLSRRRRIFQLLGLVVLLVVGTSLASWLGSEPIRWSLNSVTSRGTAVWPILLDKQTAPVTYHRLAIAHKQMGYEVRSKNEFEKAYAGYCDLGEYLIKKGSYSRALEAYSRAIDLYPDRSKPHYKSGIVYYLVGEYEYAISEYNRVLATHPNSFAANVNLALAWERINQEWATEHWQRSLYIATSSSLDKEITSWIYDYVYYPARVELTPQVESYFYKLGFED